MNRALILIPVLTLPLSACSLFTPYVDPVELHTIDTKIHPCRWSDTTSMQNALNCSQALRTEYIRGMDDQALLASVGGVSLITLTAYTAGVAVNDAHRTNVTDLTLGAAGIYGINTWLSQPTRTQIYGAGAKTIDCAVEASIPFKATSEEKEEFQKKITDFASAYTSTESSANTLQAFIQNVEAENRDKYQVALLQSARLTIEEAKSLQKQAEDLNKAYRQAPDKLMTSLLRINNDVNEGLTGTIQSVSALPGSLSGILDMYSVLKEQSLALKSSTVAIPQENGSEKIDVDEQTNPLDELKKHLKTLNTKIASLKVELYRMTPTLPQKTAESCNMDLSDISEAITLQPASLMFTETTKTLSVKVSGGSGRYISSYDETALKVKHVPSFGSILQIQAVASGAKGSFIINVSDITGAEGHLIVEVE
ncbi:MAG: hypothetical protein JXR18_12385 [Neptuniibacter sp.]